MLEARDVSQSVNFQQETDEGEHTANFLFDDAAKFTCTQQRKRNY